MEYVGKTILPKINKNRTNNLETFQCRDVLLAFSNALFGNVVWNKLYRIECFSDISFPIGYNYEDVSTSWRIIKQIAEKDGVVASISDVLFHQRIRKDSIT